MIDQKAFHWVKDRDFAMMGALRQRAYSWGSTAVYDDSVKRSLVEYGSKFDLLGWFNYWTEDWKLGSPYAGEERYEELKQLSADLHERLLGRLFGSLGEIPADHAGYDVYNAIDANVIVTKAPNCRSVLDFGAGYGRLGMLLGSLPETERYIAVDCVEQSYLLQNLVLDSIFAEGLCEYFDTAFAGQKFEFESGKSIFHLPSWRWDLVPENSVDVVSAVFVLPEINEFALRDFVSNSRRVLAPGGCIYLKDHLYQRKDSNHQGGHRLDTEQLLSDAGFSVIYSGDFEDNVEIYGIPRLYQLSK